MANEIETTKTETKVKPLDIILLIIAIVYMASPVDLIPDIPIVGWVDDITLLLTTGLNIFQKGFADTNTLLSNIAKILKWIILLLGAILVVLILLFGTMIIKMFQG